MVSTKTNQPGETMNHYSYCIGALEADTGATKIGSPYLLTLTDRESRYLLCQKIPKTNTR